MLALKHGSYSNQTLWMWCLVMKTLMAEHLPFFFYILFDLLRHGVDILSFSWWWHFPVEKRTRKHPIFTTHCPGTMLGVEGNPKAPTALESCIWFAICGGIPHNYFAILRLLASRTPTRALRPEARSKGWFQGSVSEENSPRRLPPNHCGGDMLEKFATKFAAKFAKKFATNFAAKFAAYFCATHRLSGMFRRASLAIPHLKSFAAIPSVSLAQLGHTNRSVFLSHESQRFLVTRIAAWNWPRLGTFKTNSLLQTRRSGGRKMGLCFAMFAVLTFRGPLASHDSNLRIRIAPASHDSEGPKGGRRKGGRGRKLSHFSFCCAFRCCVV